MLAANNAVNTAAVLARMRNMRALWLHSDMNAKLELGECSGSDGRRSISQDGFTDAAHCHDGSPKEQRLSKASNAIMQGTFGALVIYLQNWQEGLKNSRSVSFGSSLGRMGRKEGELRLGSR